MPVCFHLLSHFLWLFCAILVRKENHEVGWGARERWSEADRCTEGKREKEGGMVEKEKEKHPGGFEAGGSTPLSQSEGADGEAGRRAGGGASWLAASETRKRMTRWQQEQRSMCALFPWQPYLGYRALVGLKMLLCCLGARGWGGFFYASSFGLQGLCPPPQSQVLLGTFNRKCKQKRRARGGLVHPHTSHHSCY